MRGGQSVRRLHTLFGLSLSKALHSPVPRAVASLQRDREAMCARQSVRRLHTPFRLSLSKSRHFPVPCAVARLRQAQAERDGGQREVGNLYAATTPVRTEPVEGPPLPCATHGGPAFNGHREAMCARQSVRRLHTPFGLSLSKSRHSPVPHALAGLRWWAVRGGNAYAATTPPLSERASLFPLREQVAHKRRPQPLCRNAPVVVPDELQATFLRALDAVVEVLIRPEIVGGGLDRQAKKVRSGRPGAWR